MGEATAIGKKSEVSFGYRTRQYVSMFIILWSVEDEVLTISKLVLCTAEYHLINLSEIQVFQTPF